MALMAKSESDSDNEPVDSLTQLKEKVRGLNKVKLLRNLSEIRVQNTKGGELCFDNFYKFLTNNL